VSVALLIQQRHRERAIRVGLVDVQRPVVDAHDLDELVGLGEHDDGGGLLLPDHLPEVIDCFLVRTYEQKLRLNFHCNFMQGSRLGMLNSLRW